MSFTNVAVNEFVSETKELGYGGLLESPNYFGTFDSFAERFIIGPFGHLISETASRPELLRHPPPHFYMLKSLQIERWVNSRPDHYYAWNLFPYPTKAGTRYKYETKNGLKEIDHNGTSQILELLRYGCYTHKLRVYWACQILQRYPTIAAVLARKFPEIIVDEAQDCNPWLLVLLHNLRKNGSAITLVGDPDQCIFEFSLAESTTLTSLKKKWGLEELPLSRSFRCKDHIASAVKHIGTNTQFVGCGPKQHNLHGAYYTVRNGEDYQGHVASFGKLLHQSGIPDSRAAILCRGHKQISKILGQLHIGDFNKLTFKLAKAAHLRDDKREYAKAKQLVDQVVIELCGDAEVLLEYQSTTANGPSHGVNGVIWNYLKDPKRLPPITMAGDNWVNETQNGICLLIEELGLDCPKNLKRRINKRGLKQSRKSEPLFEPSKIETNIRLATIHKVKGESIDAVLVTGSKGFWDNVVASVRDGNNREERRIAYVGMTRARDVAVLSLPKSHFDVYGNFWIEHGFSNLSIQS